MTIKSSFLRFASLLLYMFFSKAKGKALSGSPISGVDFFTPYILSVDKEERVIRVTKRNWFLIGVDSKIFNFGQIRNIYIDEHVLTADIQIKVYAGNIECYWFRKRKVQLFKDQLLLLKNNGVDFGFIIE